MSGGVVTEESSGPSTGRAVVETLRMRALPSTQNRMAALILAGQVFYHATTATWFLCPADGEDPERHAQRGDGRALRTMRSTGLIRVDDDAPADARGAHPVVMTESGNDRYRSR